jgi:hypothetical protein
MSAWLWLLLAALIVLPVVLRLYAGDEPDNSIVSGTEDELEAGHGGEDEKPPRDVLRLAA